MNCTNCGQIASSIGRFCSNCGARITSSDQPSSTATPPESRQPALCASAELPISPSTKLLAAITLSPFVLLVAGILVDKFFMPRAEVPASSSVAGLRVTQPATPVVQATQPATPVGRTITPTYAELDSEVGCKSRYSEEKKARIFATTYQGRVMTWAGQIMSVDAGTVRLNIDGFGLSDLSVRFADPRATYDLEKDAYAEVRFVMKSVGGCVLPFSGDSAVLMSLR
jgi:hypothetical protein